MKIGIHYTKGFFSERWIEYCNVRAIDYKLVDCYRTDIIRQLSDCDALMWHFNHKSPRASKFAKQLLFALQAANKKVFPDYNSMWHFDDKVGQKYLLEAIHAPLAPANVFYSEKDALQWSVHTDYPKVFKLRTGAGSDNVRLVKSRQQAYDLIHKAFRRGFKQYSGWGSLKERYRKYKHGKATYLDVIKGIVRIAYTIEYSRLTEREKGYVYFQDYIPGNDYDIRVVVIGDKAFAIKRMVRKGDFRASGSGEILYDRSLIREDTVKLSFETARRLKAQCIAFDYVYNGNQPLIVEISYGFAPAGYDPCPGYWDKEMNWYEGKFNPYGWMVEDIINSIEPKIF